MTSESRKKSLATLCVSGVAGSAAVLERFSENSFGKTGFAACFDAMNEAVRDTANGKFTRQELLLASQAHALDSMFTTLALKAQSNMNAGYINATETYLKLAMKAQNQCRTTLQTLADMKHPHHVQNFHQHNSAHNQQVNNGIPAPDILPEKTSNELLDDTRHEQQRMDARTPPQTVASH